jgi:exportin-2 (importin alpha re-exporter)
MDSSTLVSLLQASISPNAQEIKSAEERLTQAENQASGQLLLELLKLVFNGSYGIPVSQSAAIFSKNLLKRRWVKSEDESLQYAPLEDQFKEQVRAALIEATCGVSATPLPRQVQAQVNAIISFIADIDFPKAWPSLLPSLVSTLQSSPSNELRLNALTCLCSVFRKYKIASRSTEILMELKYLLPLFQEVHLQLFTSVLPGIMANPSGTPKEVFAAMEQILEIFYSLNVVDIPEHYQDNINAWMNGFLEILRLSSSTKNQDEPGPVETLKTLACENLALYADKYQEPFEPFVSPSVKAVWSLLVSLDLNEACFDLLVSAGIRFLSSAANTRWTESPFEQQEALAQICEKLVLPNIQLRDTDIELFSDNPDDYIRKDLQNADAETRRRSAVDLVKALSKFYEEHVTGILIKYVQTLLGSTNDYRAKDACIQLVSAIAVKGETRAQGVTVVNSKVDINQFFTSQLVPEIRQGLSFAGHEERSVLLASALKFVILFRSQLDKAALSGIVPDILSLVHVKSAKVVQCYAAHALCLVNIIPVNVAGGMDNALSIIASTGEQNEYLIKLVAKLIGQTGTRSMLSKIVLMVNNFSSNPVNATFTHFLFEALGAVTAVCLKTDPNGVRDALVQPLCQLLDKNVMEYIPYALQVLALLIEASTSVSEMFTQLLSILMNEQLWRNPSLVPGIVRIVSAYLFRADIYGSVVSSSLPLLAARFQLLLSTSKFELVAFELLNSIITARYLPATPAEIVEPVLMGILTKIHAKRTERIVRMFGLSLACLVGNPQYQVDQLVGVLDKIQPGLSVQVIKDLWMGSLTSLNFTTLSNKHKKVYLVSLSKLLGSPVVQTNPVLIQAILSAAEAMMLLNPGKQVVAAQTVTQEPTEDGLHEFEVSYAKLSSTANVVADADFLPQIEADGVSLFRATLKGMPAQVLQNTQNLAQWTAM